MMLIQDPPKMVYNGEGSLVEVVLSAADFRAYLKSLAQEVDWDGLPVFLQDAIDRLLIDEVRDQKVDAVDLEAVLSGS